MKRKFRLIRRDRPIAGSFASITAPPPRAEAAPAPTPPPAGTLFAFPDHQGSLSAFDFVVYTDAALTELADPAPTTATVTHVKAYASNNAIAYNCDDDSTNCKLINWISGHDETILGACGHDYSAPWGSGRDSTDPPPQGAVIAEGDCSVDFDPSVPLDVRDLPPLAYDSGGDTINGVAGCWTLVLSITTDMGDCTFVCGTSFCA